MINLKYLYTRRDTIKLSFRCNNRINKSSRLPEKVHKVPHDSYKSITDDSRPSLFLSLFLSLCFPLPKLQAIMNASIFHLVPSARSYRSFLPSFLFFLPKLSLFFRAIFISSLAPFTRYRPRSLMAHDCLSRLSSVSVASSGLWTSRDLCPQRSCMSATRANPSWRFISRDADRHSPSPPALHPAIRYATLQN